MSRIHSAEYGLFPNSVIVLPIHSSLLNLCSIGRCQVSVEHPFIICPGILFVFRASCVQISHYTFIVLLVPQARIACANSTMPRAFLVLPIIQLIQTSVQPILFPFQIISSFTISLCVSTIGFVCPLDFILPGSSSI